MRSYRLLLLACVVAVASAATPLSPAARAEIYGLISTLEVSGCGFNRNGTWHTPAEAKSHLLSKLKYLEDRGAVQTAEQFIELAASRSSTSGQQYLVKCGNGAAMQSGPWLLHQLQLLRSAERAKSPALGRP